MSNDETGVSREAELEDLLHEMIDLLQRESIQVEDADVVEVLDVWVERAAAILASPDPSEYD